MHWLSDARLVLCVIGCLAVLACGGDDQGLSAPARDAGDDERVCMDEDGDGFGLYCDEGRDCDDDDPKITDECRRCRVATTEGCPCAPGTMSQACDPPDVATDGGVLVCREGTRYCRAAEWSGCESIGEYTFVAD